MSENDLVSFPDKLRYYRNAKKLTQKELGEKIGSTEITIRKYELGQRNPTPQQIIKLSKGLEVSPLQLYDMETRQETAVHLFLLLLAESKEVQVKFEDETTMLFTTYYLKPLLAPWIEE